VLFWSPKSGLLAYNLMVEYYDKVTSLRCEI
jgi:hypothetical protein